MEFPIQADTSHATPELAALLDSYFTAKSDHDVDEWMSHFSTEQLNYGDAVLGWPFTSFHQMKQNLEQVTPNWGSGKSYASRAVGDTTSGMVVVVDTPELFGSGIISLSPFDARDGKITRWVDYWDGRHFGSAAAAGMRTPPEQFPSSFGEAETGEHAAERMRGVVDRIADAFEHGDADAVAQLFSYDGVYEDLTLRTQVLGNTAVRRYLDRVIADLPYGPPSTVQHVVGSDDGGGYEWHNSEAAPNRGATMLELDGAAMITRLTTVWDGSMMADRAIHSLAARSIDS